MLGRGKKTLGRSFSLIWWYGKYDDKKGKANANKNIKIFS